jgi:hypothetical protein
MTYSPRSTTRRSIQDRATDPVVHEYDRPLTFALAATALRADGYIRLRRIFQVVGEPHMTIKIGNDLRGSRPDDLWDREGLAAYLNVSPRTIDRLHVMGEGPPRIKFGGKIRYRVSSTLAWLASREMVKGGAR